MTKVGDAGVAQREGDDFERPVDDGFREQEKVGPFKMNQFDLGDTPPLDHRGLSPSKNMNKPGRQGPHEGMDARYQPLKSEFDRQDGPSDHGTSYDLD